MWSKHLTGKNIFQLLVNSLNLCNREVFFFFFFLRSSRRGHCCADCTNEDIQILFHSTLMYNAFSLAILLQGFEDPKDK